ncbi:DUF736 family protein [Aquamicrobium sp.]|uniref:DUF736 family protein n=1 Tax=Aquamicrobium sp. TaxID=1872579 RepID=UPI0025873D13|nr:DUF736 family protein [Aquamicrobium sp.]MCK9549498.1 DUF736 family protein [Aquamicrobium sp.]
MANIGNLKRNEQGVYMGRLVHPDFSVTVYLASVTRTKERSPICEVMGLNPARDWARLGALFEQTAKKTGEIFYQGAITPPNTGGKRYYIALFRQPDGTFNVAYDEPKPRRAPISGMDMDGMDEGEPADDGLGQSTAPNSLPPIAAGDAAPMGEPLDSGKGRGKGAKAPAETPAEGEPAAA